MSRREPRRQVKIYLQGLFLPPPSPVVPKMYVGLPTPFRFKVGPALQPIAGEVAHHSPKCQTGPLLFQFRQIVYDSGPTLLKTVGLPYTWPQHPSRNVPFTRCWPNAGQILKQHWVIVPCLLPHHCAGDALLYTSPEKPLPRFTRRIAPMLM